MQKGVPAYEIIAHTADAGVRVRGGSLGGLFENAAAAMFSVMVGGARGEPAVEREFACSRDSLEELLVEWLSSLLYVFDTERVVFSRFTVAVDAKSLLGRASGELFEAGCYEPRTLIKAVTYHSLSVKCSDGEYEASVIFDV